MNFKIDLVEDDSHMCIKCRVTIVGLNNYIEHRKTNCVAPCPEEILPSTSTTTVNDIVLPIINKPIPTTAVNTFRHDYDSFPSYRSTDNDDKTGKGIFDSYMHTYEMEADEFFSSLRLKSVQSSNLIRGDSTLNTSAKTRLQSPIMHQISTGSAICNWIHAEHNSQRSTDNNEPIYEPMSFVSSLSVIGGDEAVIAMHENDDSVEFGMEKEQEDDEEEEYICNESEEEDEDDEDFIPDSSIHNKHKPLRAFRSPPAVPPTHTGGKWRPGQRPALAELTRINSPSWDESNFDFECSENKTAITVDAEKWTNSITKLANDKLKAAPVVPKQYWCNPCCKKLKTSATYNNHLRTQFHIKRADADKPLEKAEIDCLSPQVLSDIFSTISVNEENLQTEQEKKKIKQIKKGKKLNRGKMFEKCICCKRFVPRKHIGQHFVSHYHYKHMIRDPAKSIPQLFQKMHAIVHNSPFQCRPCRFYVNTEEQFMRHWNSAAHLDATEGPGKFLCSHCQFECEDNNQMRRHLVSLEHKELVKSVARSMPICISKKIDIKCNKCHSSFRYNAELRAHIQVCHPFTELSGTASDAYQSRFKCAHCDEWLRSKIALQRHTKSRHSIRKYYCYRCNLCFQTSQEAIRHRKKLTHRLKAKNLVGTMKRNRVAMNNSKECRECDHVAATEAEALLHVLAHKNNYVKNSSKTIRQKKKANIKLDVTSKNLNTCKDCKKIFENRYALKIHRDNEHPLLKHLCGSCGKSFALPQALGRHIRKCKPICIPSEFSTTITVSCIDVVPTLSDTVKTANLLLVQNNSTHTNDLTETIIMQKSLLPTETSRIVVYEQKIDSTPNTHTDFNETAVVPILNNYINPIPLNEGAKHFCHICGLGLPYKAELLFHLVHHKYGQIKRNDLIPCEMCSKKFRKDSLRCHLRQHTNEKIFKCQMCNVRFSRRHNLKTHLMTVHKLSKDDSAKISVNVLTVEEVDMCNNAIEMVNNTNSNFLNTIHEETIIDAHSNNQNVNKICDDLKCNFQSCTYEAPDQQLLTAHCKRHTDGSFICHFQDCKYSSQIYQHFQRHSKTHKEVKKQFACKKCAFKGQSKALLKRHELTHSSKKFYKCPHCSYHCTTLDYLRNHVLKTKAHPGLCLYICKSCESSKQNGSADEIFKTNSFTEYQTHCKRVHDLSIKNYKVFLKTRAKKVK
ncbi:zinc finger protein 845 [Teleopsis dalmanni]|uniref:zinc finger protein 845 n=1 Tax=Teleopsis dalmanni TaxID=139649 RepID=UPI0018CD4168|nr:zinc finger protein 845 [Teleopsis dalmanni]